MARTECGVPFDAGCTGHHRLEGLRKGPEREDKEIEQCLARVGRDFGEHAVGIRSIRRYDDLLLRLLIVLIEYTNRRSYLGQQFHCRSHPFSSHPSLKLNQLGDQTSNDGIYFIAYAKKEETPSTQTRHRI